MRIATSPKDINEKDWLQFVERHENGNIFQTPSLFKVFQKDPHREPGIIACFQDENLLGLLVWSIQREYSRPLGDLTARSIVWGGPLVAGNNQEIANQILTEYTNIVKRKAIYSEFRNLFDLDWAWPVFSKLKFTPEEHINFLITLNQSDDELLAKMSSSRRKMLHRVIRNNELVVRQVFDKSGLDEFYSLLSITYEKIKKPFPDYNHFSESLNMLGREAACFVCYIDSEPIASRFIYLFRDCVYDWYAGSNPNYHYLNPNEFIVWEILRWGRNNDYLNFDFGGGGNPAKSYGPREFKRRFGGIRVQYNRYTIIHKPFLMTLGRIGFKFKQMLS